MRTIVKRDQPATLIRHRLTPHADYDNYQDKDVLRQSLVTEQRGLCCYCLSRIRPDTDSMKVEHWRSQRRYPDEQLNYTNLLGACLGNTGQAPEQQHCDTLKADSDLSRNPANLSHQIERLVRFEGDGKIASDDVQFDAELNTVLNLNHSFLRNNRKATLDAFTQAIRINGSVPRATLERWLREWNGDESDGYLRPFCQVVVYWLRKKLSRP